MNTLTNEEIEQIFTLYRRCEVVHGDGEPYCLTLYWLSWFREHPAEWITNKLLLTPLSKITNYEALEVYGMGYTECVGKNMQIKPISEWETMKPEQYMYLISQGYAVKLYPWNKTAIELGIAIEKPLNPTHQ